MTSKDKANIALMSASVAVMVALLGMLVWGEIQGARTRRSLLEHADFSRWENEI